MDDSIVDIHRLVDENQNENGETVIKKRTSLFELRGSQCISKQNGGMSYTARAIDESGRRFNPDYLSVKEVDDGKFLEITFNK